MAGDVHDVVDPAEQPDVAVLVLLRAVAGEVDALEARPVGVLVALVVAPDRAQHRRPRLGEHQVAAAAVRHRLAGVVDDLGGRCRAAASSPRRAWPAVTPGSGLIMIEPVSVCHQVSTTGRPVAADVLAVPDPGLGVDRLADATRAAAALDRSNLAGLLLAPLHERADRGRRAVEDRDPVLLDDLPPPAAVRGVRRALRTSRWWRRWPAARRRCRSGRSPSRCRPRSSRCRCPA